MNDSPPSIKRSPKSVHERYHKDTKSARSIIKDYNFTYRLLLSVLNNYLIKKCTILDIGCGAGTISFYLAQKGHHVAGIDISMNAIQQCRKSARSLNLNIDFLEAEFPSKLPFKQRFDAIIFTEVIEHLPDDFLALQTIQKLLKNNGILILSTPSSKAPLNRLGLTTKFDKDVGHLRRYTSKELTNLLRKTGFNIIEIKKTEGILRNFLFINSYAGKLVRIANHFKTLSNVLTLLDKTTLELFGESNYIVIAKKQKTRKRRNKK